MSRVMLVQKSEKGRDFFSRMVREFGEYEIIYAADGREARKELAKTDIELMIVVAPLADEFGEALVEHASHNSCCGIIMVAKNDTDERLLIQAERSGAVVALIPISKTLFRQEFRIACATHNRMLKMRNENRSLSQKIEDMGIIDRAKCVLIQVLHMTEEQAHKYIEKQAMNMRVPRRQVAEELLKTYE